MRAGSVPVPAMCWLVFPPCAGLFRFPPCAGLFPAMCWLVFHHVLVCFPPCAGLFPAMCWFVSRHVLACFLPCSCLFSRLVLVCFPPCADLLSFPSWTYKLAHDHELTGTTGAASNEKYAGRMSCPTQSHDVMARRTLADLPDSRVMWWKFVCNLLYKPLRI